MRKMQVLLALAVIAMASSSGCSKCRNLFRRGSPCCGTVRATPAAIGAPMAIGVPAPVMQRVVPQAAPQMVMPVMPQMQCCPQAVPACPPCDPCQMPCDSGCSNCSEGYSGGYLEGGVIGGGCQDCGNNTTYDQGYSGQGYIVPGSEVPLGNGSDTRSQVDPGPVGGN